MRCWGELKSLRAESVGQVSSAFYTNQKSVFYTQSVVRGPQSAVCSPQSAVQVLH